MANIPSLKLNDGKSIPLLGFGSGTAWFKRGPDDVDQSLIDSLKAAIKLGYRHLDGAEAYRTEPELGVAIKESGVPREELFVTTKVFAGMADIPAAFEESLKKLQLDYVDLYLIHAPYFASGSADALQAAWASMEAIHATGRARSIGVSNYGVPDLVATLKTAKVVPAVNQIEYHPYLQRKPLAAYMKNHKIALAAYGPLTAMTKGAPGPLDETLHDIAREHKVSEGEVCLRWCMDQGVIAITTSGKPARMEQYLGVAKLELSHEEVKRIGEEGEKKHYRGFWTAKFEEGDRS